MALTKAEKKAIKRRYEADIESQRKLRAFVTSDMYAGTTATSATTTDVTRPTIPENVSRPTPTPASTGPTTQKSKAEVRELKRQMSEELDRQRKARQAAGPKPASTTDITRAKPGEWQYAYERDPAVVRKQQDFRRYQSTFQPQSSSPAAGYTMLPGFARANVKRMTLLRGSM